MDAINLPRPHETVFTAATAASDSDVTTGQASSASASHQRAAPGGSPAAPSEWLPSDAAVQQKLGRMQSPSPVTHPTAHRQPSGPVHNYRWLRQITAMPHARVVVGGVAICSGLVLWLVTKLLHRRKSSRRLPVKTQSRATARTKAHGSPEHGQSSQSSIDCQVASTDTSKAATVSKGPLSHLKPSTKYVPLADGSAVVIRREIAPDNSCLFNAVGYTMHKSRTRAPHLRSVVATQVAADPETYTTAFLGMPNEQYCHWIKQPYNWGGGIELSILARGYAKEIAAWNIETAKAHVFGEESGYKKQVMIIYTGNHYDALAIAKSPKANPEDDITEFNPRTKSGKLILAAAQKLVELTQGGLQYNGAHAKVKLKCADCKALLTGSKQVQDHVKATGHKNFQQVK